MHTDDTQSFEIFVHDDRYSVPTLHLLAVSDEAAARVAAEALLQVSAHHQGVELCQGGRRIAALGTCAEREPTGGRTNPLRLVSGG